MRTAVFLSELKNIQTCTSDISNAYLTESTRENILLNAGPEFTPFGHADHLLIIKTALYSIKISGDRFHSRLSDALKRPWFSPFRGRMRHLDAQ